MGSSDGWAQMNSNRWPHMHSDRWAQIHSDRRAQMHSDRWAQMHTDRWAWMNSDRHKCTVTDRHKCTVMDGHKCTVMDGHKCTEMCGHKCQCVHGLVASVQKMCFQATLHFTSMPFLSQSYSFCGSMKCHQSGQVPVSSLNQQTFSQVETELLHPRCVCTCASSWLSVFVTCLCNSFLCLLYHITDFVIPASFCPERLSDISCHNRRRGENGCWFQYSLPWQTSFGSSHWSVWKQFIHIVQHHALKDVWMICVLFLLGKLVLFLYSVRLLMWLAVD